MKLTAQPKKKLRRKRMKESAWSGFQLVVGQMVRQLLVQRVQKGDVQYARRITRSRSVIVLEYAGQQIAFLYSRQSKEILSFLPLDAPELEAWREGCNEGHS